MKRVAILTLALLVTIAGLTGARPAGRETRMGRAIAVAHS